MSYLCFENLLSSAEMDYRGIAGSGTFSNCMMEVDSMDKEKARGLAAPFLLVTLEVCKKGTLVRIRRSFF